MWSWQNEHSLRGMPCALVLTAKHLFVRCSACQVFHMFLVAQVRTTNSHSTMKRYMPNYWLMHVFNVCVHAYQCMSVSSLKKFKIKWYCIFMHLVLSCQDVSSLGGYLPRCFIFGQGNILTNLFGFCCQDVSSLGGYLPRCFIFRRGSLNKFKHCSTCALIHRGGWQRH